MIEKETKHGNFPYDFVWELVSFVFCHMVFEFFVQANKKSQQILIY